MWQEPLVLRWLLGNTFPPEQTCTPSDSYKALCECSAWKQMELKLLDAVLCWSCSSLMPSHSALAAAGNHLLT